MSSGLWELWVGSVELPQKTTFPSCDEENQEMHQCFSVSLCVSVWFFFLQTVVHLSNCVDTFNGTFLLVVS